MTNIGFNFGISLSLANLLKGSSSFPFKTLSKSFIAYKFLFFLNSILTVGTHNIFAHELIFNLSLLQNLLKIKN